MAGEKGRSAVSLQLAIAETELILEHSENGQDVGLVVSFRREMLSKVILSGFWGFASIEGFLVVVDGSPPWKVTNSDRQQFLRLRYQSEVPLIFRTRLLSFLSIRQ